MQETIKSLIKDSINTKNKISVTQIEDIARAIIKCFKNNGKVLLCGNGGSAADAQHIAGELIHQFELTGRKALPAIALSTDTSILTAIGNDWGFDKVFERQVEALCNPNDIVIGFTTSGNSSNIIKALEMTKTKGAIPIAFTGRDGGLIKNIALLSLIVPVEKTARIQESHIMAGHIICTLIEKELFGQ